MHLIQQQKRCTALSALFCFAPAVLPKTWQGGIRLISRGVYGSVAEPGGDFQQERGLAYLTRTGEQLNAAGSGLLEAVEQLFPTVAKGLANRCHSRTLLQ